MSSQSDDFYMAKALQLARKGIYTTDPNPRVGCVLVRDGQIISEGWHERAGGPHAEIVALSSCSSTVEGATAYVTLEPCSHYGRTGPCADALAAAKVKRVVIAMQDPNPLVSGQGIAKLEAAGIEVCCGIQEAEAESLNKGFIQRMRHGRPWVFSKLAMSLDGRTAMASGESNWITGSAARLDVQHLRAASSAILTGVGTVICDNPRLSVRLSDHSRQPTRLVLDSKLTTPVDSVIASQPGDTWLLTCSTNQSRRRLLERSGFKIACLPATHKGQVDLNQAILWMAEQGFNNVMVEAGAGLNGALLNAALLNEIIIYMAPSIMGNNARPLFNIPGLDSMSDKIVLKPGDFCRVGDDLRMSFTLSSK